MIKLNETKAGLLLKKTIFMVTILGSLNFALPFLLSFLQANHIITLIVSNILQWSIIVNLYIAPVLLIITAICHVKQESASHQNLQHILLRKNIYPQKEKGNDYRW